MNDNFNMNNMSTKDVIQSKTPKRQRLAADDDERNQKIQQEKKQTLIMKVTEDVETLGSDISRLNDNLNSSDGTLGKVQEYFDYICNTENKTDEYYLSILEIHGKLCPSKSYLARFSRNNTEESGLWANAIKEMYAENTPDRTHLFQSLYDKRHYHLEYTKQVGDMLRRFGISPIVKNSKLKDPKNPLANAASFL